MIRRQSIPDSNQVQVTFVLPADFPHAPLSVVGDFNQWDPSAHPLRPQTNIDVVGELFLVGQSR